MDYDKLRAEWIKSHPRWKLYVSAAIATAMKMAIPLLILWILLRKL